MSTEKILKLIFLVLGGLLVLGVAFSLFSEKDGFSNGQPPDFIEARKDAAAMSQEIVRLTSETIQRIDQANLLVAQDRSEDALSVVREAKEKNIMARGKAVEFSVLLQRIASSLSYMEEGREKELAYQAFEIERALMDEFIIYTDRLDVFLESLESVILGANPERTARLSENLRLVNEKTAAINALNREFSLKMREFDGLYQ